MVGYEGLYAIPICLTLIFIISFVPCSGDKFCVYDDSGHGHMESIPVYLRQVFSSFPLFLLVVLTGVSVPIYNYYGVSVTKYYDSLTRSLLNVCRTFVLWVLGIIITVSVGEDSYYGI